MAFFKEYKKDPDVYQFSSIEELLDLEWVKLMKLDASETKIREGFYRFSVIKHKREWFNYALIIELNNGDKCTVVGFIDEIDCIKDKIPERNQ